MSSSTGDYTGWNLWLMRNCAGCSVEPCPAYHKHRARATTWRVDYTHEPNCPDKVAS